MTERRAYNLTREEARAAKEAEKAKAAKKVRGDGWTLDQHLAEHRRLATAVSYEDQPELFVAAHKAPGRLKYWLAVGILIGAVTGAFVMKALPAPSGFSIAHYAGLGVAGLLLLILLGLAIKQTRIGINKVGLVARPWPPLPGIGVAVPLDNIRRFRVGKTPRGSSTIYSLLLLTRDEKELLIIPKIKLKRDAYLLALLLIDRVKKSVGDSERSLKPFVKY